MIYKVGNKECNLNICRSFTAIWHRVTGYAIKTNEIVMVGNLYKILQPMIDRNFLQSTFGN